MLSKVIHVLSKSYPNVILGKKYAVKKITYIKIIEYILCFIKKKNEKYSFFIVFFLIKKIEVNNLY